MKILVALTYYTPYISGLTIYAARIAQAWANRGHEVTVLTSRHDPSLPEEETIAGVRVIRAPILFRISKGAVMPAFWHKAIRLVSESDVVSIHLPQFDASWLSWLGKRKKKLTVLTYHCDLQMPPGFINQLSNKIVLGMNNLAGKWCDVIVAYTKDYAGYSFFLPKFMDKVEIVQPPVELPAVSIEAVSEFKNKWSANCYKPIIGMACRFAADKGVEVLLDAMPKVLEKYPKACVFFAGPYKDVLGEAAYYEKLRPRIDSLEATGHWHFMGSLSSEEMAKFYQTITMLVMPSLNRTDSFGLVQIEAMINGKNVVAANLPGIRVPVERHDMGLIIPIGDSDALASAICNLAEKKEADSEKCELIREYYAPNHVAEIYEELFIAHGIKQE